MKKTLHVTISNKVATYQQRGGSIVCGNEDYEIKFIFDPEWEAYENKVARFKWNGAYKDVPFSGTLCDVPKIKNATKVKVGVYVEDGPYTTTSASIPCVKSVLCENLPGQPEQVKEYRDEAAAHADRAEAAAESVRADYTEIDARVAENTERITRNEKIITNLVQGITPDPFETDSSVAYSKTVPANALPYAAVQMVGGMTHKNKNLAKLEAIFEWGVSTAFADDGKITLTTNKAYSSQYATVARASLKANTNYVISMSGCNNITTMYMWVAGTTNQLGVAYPSVPKSYTPTQDIDVELAIYTKDNTSIGTISSCYIMMNEGATALPYEPYFEGLRDAKVTAVTSGESALTIPEAVQALDGYGRGVSATCCNSIKWGENGKPTWNERVGVVDLGALNWKSGYDGFFAQGLSGAKYAATTAEVMNAKCSKYDVVSYLACTDKTLCGWQGGNCILIKDSAYTDPAAFKAAVAGVLLYYEVKTPTVTDISDLLSVDNFIEVEAGGSVVFENEHGLAVPSEIVYQVKEATA